MYPILRGNPLFVPRHAEVDFQIMQDVQLLANPEVFPTAERFERRTYFFSGQICSFPFLTLPNVLCTECLLRTITHHVAVLQFQWLLRRREILTIVDVILQSSDRPCKNSVSFIKQAFGQRIRWKTWGMLRSCKTLFERNRLNTIFFVIRDSVFVGHLSLYFREEITFFDLSFYACLRSYLLVSINLY